MRILSLAAAALLGALTFAPTQAQAGIPYVWGEHVSHVADLPEDDRLTIEGQAVKLGFEHDYVSVAGLPLWGSTEGQYVLYAKSSGSTRYRYLTMEQAEALSEAAGLTFAGPTPFSKLSMIWGLAIAVPLVGAGLTQSGRQRAATSPAMARR